MARKSKRPWYLSGPITDYPNHNEEEFATQASFLRSKGYSILNPCVWEHLPSWSECLRRDIKRLMGCQGVFVLKGWEASRGAVLEVFIAVVLGMPIRDAYTLKPIAASRTKLIMKAFRSLIVPSKSLVKRRQPQSVKKS